MESSKYNAWTVGNSVSLNQTNVPQFADLSSSSTFISPLQALADKRFSSLLVRAETQRKQASSSNTNPSTNSSHIESDAWSTQKSPSTQQLTEIPQKNKGLSPTGKSRLQGLLIGLAVAAVTTGVVAALGFTRPWETKTTAAPSNPTTTVGTCNSFRWDSVPITVAGNGSYGNASHQFWNVEGIFIDSNDTLYVADSGLNRIQRWFQNATSGITVAGRSNWNCIGNNSGLCYPQTIYVDKQQNLLIGDNYGIRLWPMGASSGTLLNGSLGLSWIPGLDMDTNGNVYAAIPNRYAIMMWSSYTANPVVVAGNNQWGYSASNLYSPYGMTVDSATNTLYIANTYAQTIVMWKINSTTGSIVAGRNMTYGAGPHYLRDPHDVKRDKYGNLYILDTENYRIMLYCADSQSGYPRTIIDLNMRYSRSMAFDSNLNIYVSDPSNYQVIKFNRIA